MAATTDETITIDARFCGPTRSGNGGYVCGRVARFIDGVATVRLHVPPPLGVAMRVMRSEGRVRLLDGDVLVAEGRAAEPEHRVPANVGLAAAETAAQAYAGFETHSFPRCFVCGTQRRPGDGLRIFAGPAGVHGIVAAPWEVDASLTEDGVVPDWFVWAALDCPSAWAVLPVQEGRALVLGQMTARVVRPVRIGERCVAMGWPESADGRKQFTASAVYGQDGSLVGSARAVWIDVPETAFPPERA